MFKCYRGITLNKIFREIKKINVLTNYASRTVIYLFIFIRNTSYTHCKQSSVSNERKQTREINLISVLQQGVNVVYCINRNKYVFNSHAKSTLSTENMYTYVE